jgi:Lon protease-like protein
MASEQVVVDFSKPIALFPLNACVLLPHTSVPLHIFEPRYRAMTRQALDSNGLIAMATFAGDDWRRDYEGNPPIRQTVCVGYIVRHQRLDAGRYTLLLHGLARAEVEQEIEPDEEGYRLARLRPLPDDDLMEIDLTDQRHELDRLINDPCLGRLSVVSAVRQWATSELPTPVLADLALLNICSDVETRYKALRETDPSLRVDMLIRELKAMHQTVLLADRVDPGPTENGCTLN